MALLLIDEYVHHFEKLMQLCILCMCDLGPRYRQRQTCVDLQGSMMLKCWSCANDFRCYTYIYIYI